MLKRILDTALSLSAIFLLSPVMLIVGLLILFKFGRPIIFSQVRPGLHGRNFKMFKFRSMRDAIDENGTPLEDDIRLTPFGKRLRETSLDELPELWNVLKGEMSIVGPRPLLTEYMELYNTEQLRRHEVRPGITGWAQINGRNMLSWDDKFRLDTWYVDHQSLWLDLKILFMTVKKVLLRDGISSEGQVTAEKFKGNNS